MRTKKSYILIFILLITITISAQNFTVKGKVVDELDDEPLVGVNLLINQLKLGSHTNENGDFEFKNIPEGTFDLKVSYIGHKIILISFSVPIQNDLIIKLKEGTVDLQEVVVTGNPFYSDSKNISQSSLTLSALDLQIKRSSNIGQTLNYQPGISMRSNGIATSRPVIRGFSNNRVLLLENGLRMGDLSNTSDDHGISSDGSTPEKIEILRGPASLLFGSNAIGGVINVITEAIPNYVPHGLNGDAKLTGSSVNREFSGSADVHFGYDKFAFHGNYFKRKSKDYTDGNGIEVSNSSQSSYGYQFGISFLPSFGLAGVSFNNFSNNYGLPINKNYTDADHVKIEMKKNEFRLLFEGENLFPFIKNISLKAGLQNYEHKEISLNTGTVGTSFGLKSLSADLSFKHDLIDSSFQSVFGFWGLKQQYIVSGNEAFTPNADYLSFAVYFFEQLRLEKFSLQFGGRFENNQIKIPASIITNTKFPAEEKSYNSLSGSFGLVFNLNAEISFFSNIANAFRAPTVEELASYAVHEATASFDIGDRNLLNENNFGLDVGFRMRKSHHMVELSGFFNSIKNYIYRRQINLFYNPNDYLPFDQLNGGLPVFRYSQTNAVLFGFEAKAQYELSRYLSTTVIFDYVRGKQIDNDENLPLIPPFRFSVEQRYSSDNFWMGLILKLTAHQNLIAKDEIPTKGFALVDFYFGIKLLTNNLIHMIDIRIDNLLDQPYKEHLSALKEFAYMPGRNIQFSYKFLF